MCIVLHRSILQLAQPDLCQDAALYFRRQQTWGLQRWMLTDVRPSSPLLHTSVIPTSDHGFFINPETVSSSSSAINDLPPALWTSHQRNLSQHLASQQAEHTSKKQWQLAVTCTYCTFKWPSPKKSKKSTHICYRFELSLENYVAERENYQKEMNTGIKKV